MILEAKSQYETIVFSDDSNEDFDKYIEFLMREDKKFQQKIEHASDDEISEIKDGQTEKLKAQINKWVNNDWKHKDSIYPERTKYGKGYKMLVSGSGERVIFYEVYTDKKGKRHARIHKCPHYKDFSKDLEEKNIKPKEDADASLLLDLLQLERQDAVRDLKSDEDGLPEDVQKEFDERKKELEKKLDSQKESKKGSKSVDKKDHDKDSESSKKESETEKKEEEVTDPETGKKIKKVKHTGERGGHFYIDDDGDRVYPEEWKESLKDIRTLITESNIIPLSEFIKQLVG